MRRIGYVLFSITLMGLMQLSVLGQDKKEDRRDRDRGKATPAVCASDCVNVPSLKHLDGRTLVFVANAENGSTQASENLQDLNSDLGLCWTIKPVGWCRHNQCYPDMADCDAQLRAAHNLACWTAVIRKDAPRAKIIFVGHSAGARVVLAAAEMAGPRSVDRIVLLNASVSTCYDLHNALRASRCGIDAFHSISDNCLEHAEESNALSDGVKGRAAGRVGFRCPSDPKEAKLYRGLRQYRFTDDLAGNGGHFAFTLRNNMKKTVVPIIASTHTHAVEIRKMPETK